ncbi:hypothetical protein [Klebsiella aerogenes]|uniref:hypothetical protein n=1 Tax=Klebsiella aerogenes TaxID=548 RepID=UPI0034D31A13
MSGRIDTILFTSIEECMEKINKDKDTLFIISINSLGVVGMLIDEMCAMELKTMLVYDIPSCRAYSHARFLSKRDTAEHIIRFLMNVLFGRRGRTLNRITSRQASIIRRLAAGQKLTSIAGNDHRSSKTISGIKKSITDKIWLKSMNDLSLLIADIIIRAARIEKS